MRYFRRSRFARFVALPFMFVAVLAACYGWTEVETTVDSPTALSNPTRVTLKSGQQIVLVDAIVTSDSVLGRRFGTSRTPGTDQSVRIALDDVQEVGHGGTNWLASGGLFVGSTLVIAAILLNDAFADQ